MPGNTTRPVTDRVKEALFNILVSDIEGSSWWDVFAGTGSIGIEALSRGASFVRFTDIHRDPIKTIRFNLEHTRLVDRSDVKRGDAFHMLSTPPDREFDYIYIAPPQYKQFWLKALQCVDSNPGWLYDQGLAIIQIHPREYNKPTLITMREIEQRKYGSTLLVFFEKCLAKEAE